MGNVNLNFYKTFCIVANYNSYSEASQKLNISSSAISTTIIRLEKILNRKLFYRNNKGIKLTEEGKRLYNRIFLSLEVLESEENIECIEDIKIGSYSHISSFYLSEKVKNASEDNPNLKITLINNMRRTELAETLLTNKVNFIIDNNENEIINKRLKKQKLKDIDNIFIFNKPLKISKLKDLQTFKYILDTQSSTDKKLMKLLEENGVSIQASIDTNSTELKINMVKQGLGITHILKDAVKRELENKEVYEVNLPIELPKTPLVLLYLNGNLRKIDKKFIKKYLE